MAYNVPMKHLALFDLIAPAYALFYRHQKKGYQASVSLLMKHLDLRSKPVLDVGCGTGALTSVISQKTTVIGIDGSPNMIKEAQKLNPTLQFEIVDISHGLPYPDEAFEVVISSFVLHGLSELQRLSLLKEMKRVSRYKVVILDYHLGRHPMISLIEWIEHGDYFHFMDHFKEEIPLVFDSVDILRINNTAAFYLLS